MLWSYLFLFALDVLIWIYVINDGDDINRIDDINVLIIAFYVTERF